MFSVRIFERPYGMVVDGPGGGSRFAAGTEVRARSVLDFLLYDTLSGPIVR